MNVRVSLSTVVVIILASMSSSARDVAAGRERLHPTRSPLSSNLLPLRFEQNVGQVDARVKFLARGRDSTVYLAANEFVLSMSAPGGWLVTETEVMLRDKLMRNVELLGFNSILWDSSL